MIFRFFRLGPRRGLLLAAALAVGCADGPVLPENRSPAVAASIPPLVMIEGQVVPVDVTPYFSDPDGDTLGYEAAASDARVVRVVLAGSLVTATAVAPGAATITVTARDSGGLAVSQDAEVTVRPNQAPETVGAIPPIDLLSGETVSLDMTPYFTDPEGRALRYEAVSPEPRVSLAAVSGAMLSVAGVAPGAVRVTVRAVDPGGLAVNQVVPVTVAPGPLAEFRADFESDDLSGWDLGEAVVWFSEGVLNLGNRLPGIAGRVNRRLDPPVTSWTVRARMGRVQTDSVIASVIFVTGSARYPAYALDVGSGVRIRDADTNYRFYVLTGEGDENPWAIVEGAYGVSEAVRDGAGEFTEVSAALEEGALRIHAGETELFAVTLDPEYPSGLTDIGLWVFPLDGAADRIALFDWVEANGIPTVAAAAASSSGVIEARALHRLIAGRRSRP